LTERRSVFCVRITAKAAVGAEESPVGEWSVNRLHMAGHGTASVVSFTFELGPKGGLGQAGDVAYRQLVLTKSSLVERRPDNYEVGESLQFVMVILDL
jgi:DnaJ family protein C protein 13